MFSESTLSQGLIQAYRETHYRVPAEGLSLVIGQASPQLERLHRAHLVDCSAFITACNPFSAELTPAENAQRQQYLAVQLRSQGLDFVEGIGQHPSNGWPGEPSFLIFGLALEQAKALALSLEQNGLVWSGSDATPNLILLK